MGRKYCHAQARCRPRSWTRETDEKHSRNGVTPTSGWREAIPVGVSRQAIATAPSLIRASRIQRTQRLAGLTSSRGRDMPAAKPDAPGSSARPTARSATLSATKVDERPERRRPPSPNAGSGPRRMQTEGARIGLKSRFCREAGAGLHLRVPVPWDPCRRGVRSPAVCAVRACARRLRQPRTCLPRGDPRASAGPILTRPCTVHSLHAASR